MKLICDCGEITEFINGEDGTSYTEGEGWYKVTKGRIDLHGEHDQVFFHCHQCGAEIWIFT